MSAGKTGSLLNSVRSAKNWRFIILLTFTLLSFSKGYAASGQLSRCISLFTEQEGLFISRSIEEANLHQGLMYGYRRNRIEMDVPLRIEYRGAYKEWKFHDELISEFEGQPKQNFPVERWTIGDPNQASDGKNYYLVNAGLGDLENLNLEVGKAYKRYVKSGSGIPLRLNMDDSIQSIYRSRSILQHAALTKVIDEYKHRKAGYIDEKAAFNLAAFDFVMNDNSDFLVVMDSNAASARRGFREFLRGDYKHLESKIVMVMKIVYQRTFRLFQLPSDNFNPFYFPFIARLKIDDTATAPFLSELLQTLNGREAAEITRWVKFKRVPEGLQEGLITSTLQLGIDKGVKVFLASADDKTSVIFRRMGFKSLRRQLPTGSATAEYLMYFDTDSPEFKMFFDSMKEKWNKNVIEREPVRITPRPATSLF